MKTYNKMTKKERAHLMMTDYPKYAELVPDGHWLQLLENVAASGGDEEALARRAAWKKVHQLAQDGNKRYRQTFP